MTAMTMPASQPQPRPTALGNAGPSGRCAWCLAVLVLALLTPVPAVAAEKVRLQLKWQHQFQFAGYYAAQARGFYRDAGLDVDILPNQPGEDPAEKVLSGRAEFGVGSSELVLLREKGKPVVVLAVIFQHSPLVLFSLKQSGIQSIHDLVGRKVMVEMTEAELVAYLQKEGVRPDRVTMVPHQYGTRDLLSGAVDAMSGYSTDEPFDLERSGQQYQAFSPRSAGVDFYGDNLFTTQQLVERRPELVKAFRTASLKGWQYAMANQAEVARLIHTKYSDRHTLEHLEFEARQMAPLLQTSLVEVGHMNPGRWRHIADTYAELGLMKPGFGLEGFLYSPNPPRSDMGWLYWVLSAVSVVVGAVSGVALHIYRINGRLRHEAVNRQAAEDAMRQARDAAENANRVKDQFLAKLSHELRTPLTPALLSASQWRTRSDLPEELRNDLSMICRSLEMEVRLMDDLLDVNRILYGKLSLRREPVGVHHVITDALAIVAKSAQAKRITVTLKLEATHDRMDADPMRLQQVFWNLLKNAIKFTPDGGSVTVTTADDSEGWLRAQVADTGMGIEPGLLPHLFEPFQQGGRRVNYQYGGLGLGLAICKAMAEANGGTIEAASEGKDRGATFTVRLPVSKGDAVARPVVAPPHAHPSAGPLRILLVEDDASTSRVMTYLLANAGHTVEAVNSIGAAQRQLGDSEYDLLISDLGLSDGSGIQLMKHLASVGKSIPAIAVTGHGMEDDIRASREAGFAQHLVKPVNLLQLETAIAKVMARK